MRVTGYGSDERSFDDRLEKARETLSSFRGRSVVRARARVRLSAVGLRAGGDCSPGTGMPGGSDAT